MTVFGKLQIVGKDSGYNLNMNTKGCGKITAEINGQKKPHLRGCTLQKGRTLLALQRSLTQKHSKTEKD